MKHKLKVRDRVQFTLAHFSSSYLDDDYKEETL